MSWWKKTLRAIGIGAEVAGEVVKVVQPGSVIGAALDKGGEALARNMAEVEAQEKKDGHEKAAAD